MTNLTQAIEQEMQSLARVRDEVRLQLHLAKADAKDAFDKLEARWPEFEAKAEAARDEGAHEVAEAAKGLARELKAGYEEVYRRITKHV